MATEMTKMEKALSQAQYKTHQKSLEVRNLDNLINSQLFMNTFYKADDKNKEKLIKLINDGELEKVKKLYYDLKHQELELKPVAELRSIARSIGITGVSYATKEVLLYIIKKERESNEKE